LIIRSITYKPLIFFSWFISLCLYLNSPANIEKTFMIYTLLHTALCSLFFFLYQRYIFKKLILFSITTLFVLAITITHFQIPVINAFGFEIVFKWFSIILLLFNLIVITWWLNYFKKKNTLLHL